MSKFSLTIKYNRSQNESSIAIYSFNIDARDNDEAICAADAIATFIENRIEKNLEIIVFDLKTANEVRRIVRPRPSIEPF